jgi:thiol-disulfide isomerase/thioredoxin
MTSQDRSPAANRRARQREAALARAELARARARRDRHKRLAVRALAGVAVAAAVLLVGTGLSRAGRPDAGFSAAFDRHAGTLEFQLPAFAGGTVSSAALRGKPAVVNFYASWCEVCHAELPAFQAVHQQAGDTVAFVGVNPQSNDSDGAQADMIKETGVRYPTARDRHDDLLRLFNTTGGLPTTLFLDAQGRVVQVHNGGFDEGTLKAAIRQYLGVAV